MMSKLKKKTFINLQDGIISGGRRGGVILEDFAPAVRGQQLTPIRGIRETGDVVMRANLLGQPAWRVAPEVIASSYLPEVILQDLQRVACHGKHVLIKWVHVDAVEPNLLVRLTQRAGEGEHRLCLPDVKPVDLAILRAGQEHEGGRGLSGELVSTTAMGAQVPRLHL